MLLALLSEVSLLPLAKEVDCGGVLKLFSTLLCLINCSVNSLDAYGVEPGGAARTTVGCLETVEE